MVQQVTEAWLTEVCGGRVEELSGPKAYWVAAQMGLLAPWWLREEVLQKARCYVFSIHGDSEEVKRSLARWEPVRRVPRESGCCWPVLINRRPEELGLLRRAFVFPLRWIKGQPHHPYLPKGLQRLAGQVLSQLRQEGKIDQDAEWGLRPLREEWLQELNLSDLAWEWESAWVPLAAGLLLAYWEGTPDPSVWATGAYQVGQGIREVEGVGPKALVAWQMGAKVFFAPQGQEKEVRQFFDQQQNQPDLEILCLEAGSPELHKALGCYLARLEVPPAPEASPEHRRDYFLRIPDDQLARRYYTQCILPDVWQQKAPDLAKLKPTCLVIIVSKGYDLVELAAGLVRPQRCLLLFNEEMKEVCQQIPARLKEMGLNCECLSRKFVGQKHEDLVREFRQAIADFLGPTPAEQLIADLTAGQKSMTLALYDAAPEGCFVMCCQTPMDKDTRRPVPFEERIDYWQVRRGKM